MIPKKQSNLSGRRWRRRLSFAFLGLLLALIMLIPAHAQPTYAVWSPLEEERNLDLSDRQSSSSSTPVLERGLDDHEDLANFINQYFAQDSVLQEAPGAAVAVVKDGELIFSGGYGYADLEQQTPVDPDRTRFRVASLSKLFTATATVQLAEQGQFDLDDAIADYLGDAVQLDNPYDTEITFKQMLTHTDGSTKRRLGLAAATQAAHQPLQDYLSEHLPPIVYPPGKLFSYSSHSFALLGYLLQRIADQPFVDYMDEALLNPLAMNRSSFAQPPPQRQALATGYRKRGRQFEAVPYLYLNIGPGAALSSTATDLSHFMIAHLEQGQYQSRQVLQPESVAKMQQIHFRPHPQLPGTGYGFRERRVNGLNTLGHLGSLRGYSSSMTLLPEQNIGIVILSNSLSGVHSQLLKRFFDRYFPVSESGSMSGAASGIAAVGASGSASESPFGANSKSNPDMGESSVQESSGAGAQDRVDLDQLDLDQIDLDQFAGLYRDLEYPRHTLAKVTAPFAHIRISRTDTGLMIQPPDLFFRKDKPPSHLEPIGPRLFRHREDGTLTAFETNENGEVTYAYNPILAKMATFTKVGWYENPWLHLAVLGIAALLFLSSVWVWPIAPAIRWIRGKSATVAPVWPLAWQVAGGASLLQLIFWLGFPISLWLYGAWKLAYGMPTFGLVFLTLPLISTILTAIACVMAVMLWVRQDAALIRRLQYGGVTLALVAAVILMAYWRLLGYQI